MRWFARNGRDMEWRRTRDPYRIWVSEVMLQQTTVRIVVPYYRRFIERFPTLAALAATEEEQVLKAWEGLGYYARARNLHAAAREVMRLRGGRLPDAVSDLVTLPGVGRSTAGAVAAIAFGKDEPILDANVRRVASRLVAAEGNTRSPAVERRLWQVSRALIAPGRGRETALALMDIGAAVCLPRRPRCDDCPLSPWCAARANGMEERIPERKPSKAPPRRDYVAAVVRDAAGRLLLAKRPAEGMLGGLWEFPGGRVREGESPEAAVRRLLRETVGLDAVATERVAVVERGFSHFRMTLHVFRIVRPGGGRPAAGGNRRWVRPQETSTYAFSAAHRKIAEFVRTAGNSDPTSQRRRRSTP